MAKVSSPDKNQTIKIIFKKSTLTQWLECCLWSPYAFEHLQEYLSCQKPTSRGNKCNRWRSQVAANQQTHTTISAWPSAYCGHSAVMTPQSPEPRPPRWWREQSNQSIFSAAVSFASSQKAITGCSCKHFCTTAPLRHAVKTDGSHRSLFNRGSPPECTLKRRLIQRRGQNTQNSPRSWILSNDPITQKKQERTKGQHSSASAAAAAAAQHQCNMCVEKDQKEAKKKGCWQWT